MSSDVAGEVGRRDRGCALFIATGAAFVTGLEALIREVIDAYDMQDVTRGSGAGRAHR